MIDQKFMLLNNNIDINNVFSDRCDLLNYVTRHSNTNTMFYGKRVQDIDMTVILQRTIEEYSRETTGEDSVFDTKMFNSVEPNVKKNEEYFLIQRQNTKKLHQQPVSHLDGGNLMQNLKGEKNTTEKKNDTAQFVNDKETGKNLIDTTMGFFFNYDKSFTDDSIKIVPFKTVFDTLSTQTFIRDTRDIDRVFFIDTFSKLDFLDSLPDTSLEYKQFKSLRNTVNYLHSINKQMNTPKKKKIFKFPCNSIVSLNSGKLIFSLQMCVTWLETNLYFVST